MGIAIFETSDRKTESTSKKIKIAHFSKTSVKIFQNHFMQKKLDFNMSQLRDQ